jgi:hypothetical protein
MLKKLTITCLACCLCIASYSQASKKEKIRKLIDVVGSAKMGVQVIQNLMPAFQRAHPTVPQQFWDDFVKAVRPEDLTDLIVPIYDKHFSEEDIDQIIAFYNSPIGKKLISEMPMIMQESMSAGQAWGKQLAGKVASELKEKGYEHE